MSVAKGIGVGAGMRKGEKRPDGVEMADGQTGYQSNEAEMCSCAISGHFFNFFLKNKEYFGI